MDNPSVEKKRVRREKIPQEPLCLADEIAKLRGVSPSEVTIVKCFNENRIETNPPYPGYNPLCEKKPTPRPKIHIEPMNLREELAKIESCSKSVKKPLPVKSSPSIRKELFKPRKSITGRPSFSTKQPPRPATNNLSKKTSSTASNKAVIKIHKASPIRTRKAPNVYASPMTEFLEMEKQCEVNVESTDSDLLTKIAAIVERDRKLLQTYQEQHSANLKEIEDLIQKQTIRKKIEKQPSEKPGIRQDLRKNIFKRNLEDISEQISIEEKTSPRRERGLSLYNSLRNDFVLATPRNDKFGNNSTTKSFSEKIQEQCLLLQGTPKPK